jgi:beta-glucosidase
MFNKENHCKLKPDEIIKRSASALNQMTLKEKVWLLNGNWQMLENGIRYKNFYNPTPIETNGLKRLTISPIRFSDGPRGVVMGRSTCFPVSMARGASFDRGIEKRIGDVIGKEARAQGANFFGGVCINLLRHPAWGRAQETYSEDPFHLGEMGKALTLGVQNHNVMACLKHYALNNIENSRFFVNVRIDERALREVYLPHFKKSIQAGAASVMGAYNLYEGEQACESKHLLTEILREDWGFEGFTISDFIFGIRDTQKAIEAGLDVEMPLPIHYQRKLLEMVEAGKVDEKVIDQAALRIIRTLIFFENCLDPMAYTPDLVTHPAHTALAQEAAEKSMVLIKNEGAVLPFDENVRRVLILGKLADRENTGDHGSSRVYPPYVITPLAGLKKYFDKRVKIIHLDETQIPEAKKIAPEVDCVIIVAGNDYSDEGEFISPGGMEDFLAPIREGYRNMGRPVLAALMKLFGGMRREQMAQDAGGDRQNLSLKTDEIKLIREIGPLNPRTVVTLVCGSMIMIDDWAEQVPAVLYSWYAGMEGGTALARILFGDSTPSGKLPFSIPQDVHHLPHFSSSTPEIEYDLYHGYTLLDKDDHKPHYPFGYGLSYTTFDYQDLRIQQVGENIDVSVKVSNSGERDGEEVVQVYVGMRNSQIERQKKLLKGFEKVPIQSGKSTAVTISIPLADLRYYNIEEKKWILEAGTYTFMAGSSSADEDLLKADLEIWRSNPEINSPDRTLAAHERGSAD